MPGLSFRTRPSHLPDDVARSKKPSIEWQLSKQRYFMDLHRVQASLAHARFFLVAHSVLLPATNCHSNVNELRRLILLPIVS